MGATTAAICMVTAVRVVSLLLMTTPIHLMVPMTVQKVQAGAEAIRDAVEVRVAADVVVVGAVAGVRENFIAVCPQSRSQ